MISRTLHACLVIVTDLQCDGDGVSANGCWRRQYVGVGKSRASAERNALRQYGTGWRADGWAGNDGSWRMRGTMIGAYVEEGGTYDLRLEGLHFHPSQLSASGIYMGTVRVHAGPRQYDVSSSCMTRKASAAAMLRDGARYFATEDYLGGTAS